MYPVADGTFRIGTDVRAELRRVADETAADETCRVLHEVLAQFRQADNNGVVPDGEVLAFVGPTVTPETYRRWCDSAGAWQDGAQA